MYEYLILVPISNYAYSKPLRIVKSIVIVISFFRKIIHG